MNVRKKLVKEIKKTNPNLADEIKYMTKKEFRALMEVFNVWCRPVLRVDNEPLI